MGRIWAAEEAVTMSRHPHPSPISTSTEKAWRRTPFRSLRSLGILITLIGGIALFSLSIFEIGRRAGVGLSQWMPGILGDDNEKIKDAQYSNNTFGPGRIFRNNDATGYDAATIPGKQHSKSTYERLWPGYNLPRWAYKVRHFRDFQPPIGHSICYVHVGKTAGSSIGCALGFCLRCQDDKQYLPGRLPKSATHVFHKGVYDCPNTADFYLIVVRDPLARSRSAFVYGRPDEHGQSAERKRWKYIKQFYSDCPFSTANELASMGLTDNGEATDECKQRARDMLRGLVRYEDHMFFNYQYYLESIPHKSNILVIRTEHMEEDWNNIELRLGGTPGTNLTFPHDNSQPKEARDSVLGDDERMLLCHELCVEIQTYKLMLRNALNIDQTQYNTSMEALQASCPNEAMLKQCDFHTPNIKTKLLENRGELRE
mmetsp:Transcript_16803/g.30465  ORF Transcript_16803/g.30465 Transcript_16803/m.30465 type:complete len:428 (-) Transcript_16803:184-1467(-)|eukprot:CAMPEP_0201868342 /NCGR_PEP_ID=MMETSP0902-20130614/2267_1 /ASSEMBLY_ACC=CAM_ASM_000551 /TAXON_ID=420261 /ORGANISM="Thalassiosira antarctica, Strain CCMP982" /LENGTH=427 /DNA_ID=CAMNT_0048393673 /DNA_START=49 /DNA_END=1332 /DNA_ORIENTATION=-